MQEKVSLFVYGSFCEGMVHYQRLSDYVVGSEKAWAKGTAYRLPVGFPVFLNEGSSRVEGSLIEMDAPEVFFKILDEFHGFQPMQMEKSLYWKQSIEVEMASGDVRSVLAYVLNPKKLPRNAQIIEDGDWRSSLQSQPAVTDTLTSKQTDYVKKLGRSTGRDKGRRLALTKLGKEVYRFLS